MKNNTVLLIDTSSNKKIRVGIRIGRNEQWIQQDIAHKRAQVTLMLIDKLLKKKRIDFKALEGIEVNTGPGSFTGLRVGIAVANALSYSLKIPLNNKKVGEIVNPVYE